MASRIPPARAPRASGLVSDGGDGYTASVSGTAFPKAAGALRAWWDGLSDAGAVALCATLLFVLSAWPLLLVELPPLQDLPNHIASAYIIAHPDLYPQYVFNGFFKSNSLLTLWLYLFGGLGLFTAARAFTALVLAAGALALPIFVLRFAGRSSLARGMLFAWPLVHGFFVSMGMLNFSFAFALSLILLVLVDRQRERATWSGAGAVALVGTAVWYAHPFPLMVVIGLVGLHALRADASWRGRARAGLLLLSPLVPLGALSLLAAQQHLVKAERARAQVEAGFAYLPPWETVGHLWLDASGALTRWGGVTLVPAVLLVYFGWKQRRVSRPLFSPMAMVGLTAAYFAVPSMVSNWCYLNSRLVPFLWVGAIARLPERLPRRLTAVLALAALWFSAAMGVDYVRLERDRAAFDAGTAAVPARATLLPLLFAHGKTSDFVASLTHAWADYVLAKSTSAPLVFAVERSYPITYREFPPPALIPPALDQFAEKHATAARACKLLGRTRQVTPEACVTEWRRQWAEFWREAEPRFSHVLTWAMPGEAHAIIPASYRRIFVAGALELYERTGSRPIVSGR